MKKLMFFAFMLTSIMLTGCDKETILNENDIPAEIKTYVETHFPGSKILQCVKDKDGLELNYDVIIDGNFKLEFNKKKEIESIDGNSKLPDSVIPAKILAHVQANFPSNFITDWELNRNDQEVELDNGMELLFNKDGDFLRIDN